MRLLRHHPAIGKLPCEGYDWRLSHPELDALIWREGEELAPRRASLSFGFHGGVPMSGAERQVRLSMASSRTDEPSAP
jgi:hypothetical protein